MSNGQKYHLNLYNKFELSIQNWFIFGFNCLTSVICKYCANSFYLFLFKSGFIHPVINLWRTESIINTGIFIAVLKIADGFSKQKVSFLFSLINSKLDIKVKLVFTSTNWGIDFYFCLCIYNFLFLFAFKQTSVIGK